MSFRDNQRRKPLFLRFENGSHSDTLNRFKGYNTLCEEVREVPTFQISIKRFSFVGFFWMLSN